MAGFKYLRNPYDGVVVIARASIKLIATDRFVPPKYPIIRLAIVRCCTISQYFRIMRISILNGHAYLYNRLHRMQ